MDLTLDQAPAQSQQHYSVLKGLPQLAQAHHTITPQPCSLDPQSLPHPQSCQHPQF